jgi:glycosyltransferase involved in cell wall biosynthesis
VSWLNQVGGAERVLEAVHELFPEAPIFTSIYWPEAMPPHYLSWDIRTSWLDKLPFVRKHHRILLPLYPLCFEGFDLGEYDLVLSITSAFAHGVITTPRSLHICYCLTPARFLWNYKKYVEREEINRLALLTLQPFLNYLRLWDRLAADRVDHFIAISQVVRKRILKHYRRDSEVIHPPVDTSRYAIADSHEDYFLIVSRLVPYKRIDLAVQAFNELGLPLMIAGDGRDRRRLEAMAGDNIRFLGRISAEKLAELFAHCKAFIFPGLEDFGIAPLEAQATGRPVIAYAGGGALETVVEGVTGTFFHEQTPEALAETIRRFDDSLFDPEAIRRNAERFDKEVFKEKLRRFIEENYDEHMEKIQEV